MIDWYELIGKKDYLVPIHHWRKWLLSYQKRHFLVVFSYNKKCLFFILYSFFFILYFFLYLPFVFFDCFFHLFHGECLSSLSIRYVRHVIRTLSCVLFFLGNVTLSQSILWINQLLIRTIQSPYFNSLITNIDRFFCSLF